MRRTELLSRNLDYPRCDHCFPLTLLDLFDGTSDGGGLPGLFPRLNPRLRSNSVSHPSLCLHPHALSHRTQEPWRYR
jgi:hypothetical protein